MSRTGPPPDQTKKSPEPDGVKSSAERYPPGHQAKSQPAASTDRPAVPTRPAPRETPAGKTDAAAVPREEKEKPAKTGPPASSPDGTTGPLPAAKTPETAEKQKPAGSPAAPRKSADGSAKIDSLLPPGSTSQPTAASRPLPVTSGQLGRAAPEGPAASLPAAAGIPTEDGGFIRLHEPVKKIEYGGEEIELHRLTPEERARKRMFKNMIMAIIGVILLVGMGAILMYFF